MDLSGNVWERPVTLGNATGRGFNGAKHGNGTLTSSGDGDVPTWPAANAIGSGYRGGGWNYSTPSERLSDRSIAAAADSPRYSSNGGRGVRSAP